MGSYHNTTNDPNAEHYEELAGRQDQLVLDAYQAGYTLSPSQVHQHLIGIRAINDCTPLTSIRRSITNLTSKGLLIKTEQKREGVYGRLESCWQVAPPVETRQLTLFG